MRVPPRPAVRRVRRRPLAVAGIVLLGLLFLLGGYFTFQTELLWFQETGFEKVFWAGIWVRLGLAVTFGLAFAFLLLVNLWIVRKLTNPARLFSVADEVLERYRATLQPYTKWVVIGAAVLFGLFAGSGASIQWREWLLFQNGVDFGGAPDPVFGKDIGFYVFRLPFHRFLFTWGFSTLVVITLVTAAAHYFMGGIRPQARGDRVAPEVRAHLSVLLGLIVLLKAWGYRLDQFNLLYSSRGTVTGASYTDVNAQLPALRLLVVIAVVCAVFFLVNARARNWILPIGGIGLLALMSVVAGGIYPAAIQRLRVTPNEQLREATYIDRNIQATRKAFQLENVKEVPFEASTALSAREVARNRSTIQNIRLWEPRVLARSYLQLQRIKQYYEFLDVDVDRYTFDGERRQVMLSPREMDQRALDESARTWVNEHLVYTHGYGVVASRVDRVTAEGQPSFIVRNIPPVSVPDAPKITQPRVYFGEAEQTRFVVVNTEQEELDYPQGEAGDQFAGTRYEGKGGIKLGGILRRAAFAWRFRDMNLLISGTLTDDSKIMFRRSVFDRVRQVAPFLHLDDDPYIAVVDGRLQWIIDAYTTTDMYPYAQRVNLVEASDGSIRAGQANYLRNSVKIVVDAEHGTIDAYLWDDKDPIVKAWAKAFPGIFKPRSAMPESVLAHVRYPEGLFAVQTERFSTYHIDGASNFYSKEDAWRVANDPTAGGLQTPRVPPYYILMKLPGEERLDFVLVRPFTPNGRQNLTAFMVAHGDPDKYGQLVTYVFPKRDAIFGPEQVQARINGDTTISPEITLLSQGGSRIIYGNLLIVPIEQSLLYVQPLYVQGSGSSLPELKRVVAVSGEKVKMATTLEGALDAIFGEEATTGTGEERPEENVAALIAQAITHDQRAQAALRRGDFTSYGREQDRMRRALDRAAQLSGATPSPSPSPSPS